MRPTVTRPVQDTLAVKLLDNLLYILMKWARLKIIDWQWSYTPINEQIDFGENDNLIESIPMSAITCW